MYEILCGRLENLLKCCHLEFRLYWIMDQPGMNGLLKEYKKVSSVQISYIFCILCM